MANHTPGPWLLKKLEDSDRVGRGSQARKDYLWEIEPSETYPHSRTQETGNSWDSGAPCHVIARVPFDSGCFMENEAEANAAVLAAATELLEVAQACLDAVSVCGLGGSNTRLEKKLEKQLRAVITKAAPPPAGSLTSGEGSKPLPRNGGGHE